ncbi:MAG TPA: serine hydrolase domain-containing protein [Steroidobacteraceae bacterium]|nr:serine hydrolase domain-containing protein [Steroidobacteraceae bacterium]
MLQKRVSVCLDGAVAENRLVGAVVIVAKDGEKIVEAVAGLADREAGRRMTADTIFRYSSLTKPAAAMALVERGMIRLDDPVTRWVPEFAPKSTNGGEVRIEVRHLLTHTAGLTYRLLQPEGGTYEKAGVSDGMAEPGLPMAEELERLSRVPLEYPPGSAWGYSLAYDVLGERAPRARPCRRSSPRR